MYVGVFDSGLGGLTIYKSIKDLLPEYDYIYLGDNARTPYGNRSYEAILKFTTEAVEFLFKEHCKLIIIACNTASAKALRSIQQRVLPLKYADRRVLGVIRPSVEEISRYSQTKVVALWATEGTVKSDSFVIEMKHHAPGIRLIQTACPLLVPFVEAGETDGPATEYFVRKYWDQTAAQSDQIDVLLLACTHYPILFPVIRNIVPQHVKVLMQGDFVAPSLQDYLSRHPEIDERLSRGRSEKFLTTDQNEGFDRLAEVFLGYSVISEKVDL
jgi:glutamate racemase